MENIRYVREYQSNEEISRRGGENAHSEKKLLLEPVCAHIYT